MTTPFSDYFDNWYFTTPKSSNQCPSIPYMCSPPNACARDPSNGRQFCCDVGPDSTCWTTSTPCVNDGSAVSCGARDVVWCCLKKTEKCTETFGQINICWSTANDTLRQIDESKLTSLYTSLNAAQPTATSLTFTPIQLVPDAATTTSTLSTGSAATTTTTRTKDGSVPPTGRASAGAAINTDGSDSSGSSSPSGATVAGTIVGAIAAVAVMALLIFLVLRRRKRAKEAAATAAKEEAVATTPGGGGGAGAAAASSSLVQTASELDWTPTGELDGQTVSELDWQTPLSASSIPSVYWRMATGGGRSEMDYGGGSSISNKTEGGVWFTAATALRDARSEPAGTGGVACDRYGRAYGEVGRFAHASELPGSLAYDGGAYHPKGSAKGS